MARKGGDSGDLWGLLGILIVAGGLAYLTRGRGTDDSPHIPNLIEDQIDFVVEALNQKYDHGWVNERLDDLQAYIESKFPQVAVLVSLLYAAEGQYIYTPKAGYLKKQAVLQMYRRLRG